MVRMVVLCISAYGVYAFIHRQLGEYMMLRTQYVFFDFREPMLFFIADYIAILLMSAFIGYYLLMILTWKEHKS